MTVHTEYLHFATRGNADVVDITPDVSEKLEGLKIKSGIVNINVCGSTGALTTCEFEPGLVQDIKDIFDKILLRIWRATKRENTIATVIIIKITSTFTFIFAYLLPLYMIPISILMNHFTIIKTYIFLRLLYWIANFKNVNHQVIRIIKMLSLLDYLFSQKVLKLYSHIGFYAK